MMISLPLFHSSSLLSKVICEHTNGQIGPIHGQFKEKLGWAKTAPDVRLCSPPMQSSDERLHLGSPSCPRREEKKKKKKTRRKWAHACSERQVNSRQLCEKLRPSYDIGTSTPRLVRERVWEACCQKLTWNLNEANGKKDKGSNVCLSSNIIILPFC